MTGFERRRVLKAVGVGLAGLATTGKVGASDGSPLDEADFDPSDREAVLEFLYRTFEYSSSKPDAEVRRLRSTLAERLTDAQKEGIREAWEGDVGFTADVTERRDSGTATDDPEAEAWESYSYTISTSITIPLCPTFPPGCYDAEFAAYDFTHELQWFYSDGEVTSGTATVDATAHNYAAVYWNYEGVTGSQKELHPDGYYVATWREGRFDQQILIDQSPTVSQYPSCWVQGDNNGYGSAYDIEYQ